MVVFTAEIVYRGCMQWSGMPVVSLLWALPYVLASLALGLLLLSIPRGSG